jgi:SAM-dependent methyltransferase
MGDPGRHGSPATSNRYQAFEARDPFEAGLFPVCVATHDLGVRRLFDLATVLLLLNCRPGDRVLDIGAGSGFSSEMLARLGYDVVALDQDREALKQNRRRPGFDATRIEGTVRVTQGLAERLPFAARSFDGVLGMNVMHHVADLPAAVSELARVLKPGCQAVFSEPGLDHVDVDPAGHHHLDVAARRAIRELGEDDQAFDVLAFLRMARERGFRDAMLSATLQSPLSLLPIDEVELFASGQHPRPHLTPRGILQELHRHHPFAMLVREGERPRTSRNPGSLRCELQVGDVPAAVRRGGRFTAVVRAANVGDTVWLARPSPRGGYVTAGCKVLTPEGRLITDRTGRACLPSDVPPGGAASVTLEIALPQDLEPGRVQLQFDLVDELVCWFSDASGQPPVTYPINVE